MLTMEQVHAVKQYVAKLKLSWPGLFFYYCIPFRKQIVLSNIQQVFSGALTLHEMKKLAKAFYGHVARFLFENIQLRFLSIDQIKERVEVIGHEYFLEAYQQGRGVALLTGHFGNWELGPVGGILNFQVLRNHFYVIRKTLNAKWLEKILFRRFFDAGVLVISKKNALNHAVDAIEAKNAVVFIMDQYASIRAKDGIAVEFFGKKTGTYKSLAMIAQHTHAVVIPARCYRVNAFKHVLEFYPPIEWVSSGDEKMDIYLNTRGYNQKVEDMLLLNPEQWLWFHKRWKSSESE